MAITYKALTENGKQAILELDKRGTSALIQDNERVLWNKAAETGKDTFYGVCWTDTSISEKEVDVGENFQLKPGVMVTVYFRYAVMSSSQSNRGLNVNGLGSYPIQYNGSSSLHPEMIPGEMRALFVFDGTAWQLLNPAFKNKVLMVLTFGSYFAGKQYTVISEGMSSYSDVVPACLEVTLGMVDIGKLYTVICDGYSKTFVVPAETGIYHGYFNVLEVNTWEEIAVASAFGMADKYWQVGDEKTLSLGSFGTVTLQIYGFAHDDLASGTGKAGITFGLKNLLKITTHMETSGTNSRSFISTCLYDWLIGDVWGAMPANLRSAIKSVKKRTSAGGRSTTIRTDNMSLFLFSQMECMGSSSMSCPGEGSKYSIFTDRSSRIKALANGSGNNSEWWTRSPCLENTSDYVCISTTGTAKTATATSDKGICFGFCI